MEAGYGANRLTSRRVAHCYFTKASEWLCKLYEGHGRSRCCLLIRGGRADCFVWFRGASLLSHIKVRPWSVLGAAQVGSYSAYNISIWQRRRSGVLMFEDTVSVAPTVADGPSDEWKRAWIRSSGSFKQHKKGRKCSKESRTWQLCLPKL